MLLELLELLLLLLLLLLGEPDLLDVVRALRVPGLLGEEGEGHLLFLRLVLGSR